MTTSTASARCAVTSCSARIPTVVRYVPVGDDRYLLTTPVDPDALRVHLVEEHSSRRPALTQVVAVSA